MISIVIPTYEEEENIQHLLEEIDRAVEEEYEIILVDDSIDDLTSERARETDLNVNVVRRNERGIGSALKEGFSHIKGDVVVQMDADFSHPPEKIPELVEKVRSGVNVAVGSRYVEGGDRNDSLYRRIFPLIGSYLYRYLLKCPVRDFTSGFKAYDRETARLIQEPNLPDGFHFQAASLMKAISDGKKVEEVPIDFRPRKAGDPKYDYRDLLDNILLFVKLFVEKNEKLLKFGTVGASGFIVNMSLLYILTEFLGLYYLYSSIIAVESSIISNFTLNELWTFIERGKEGVRHLFKRFLKFNTVSLVGLGINISLLYTLTEFLGVYYLVSNLIAVSVVFLWNYIMNVRWTW